MATAAVPSSTSLRTTRETHATGHIGLAAQERLAKLSRNSIQRTVVGATHAALLEDKGFAWITSRAIAQVVQFTGSGPLVWSSASTNCVGAVLCVPAITLRPSRRPACRQHSLPA